MTLKERILPLVADGSYVEITARTIEDIADEFAIGFAEWLALNCYRATDGNYWLTKKEGDVKKNSTELLEIYKKEKDL
jgi:hypothetical protein